MRLEGTVVADPETVHTDGAVVVEGSRISFVGDRSTARYRHPDHVARSFDVLLPGLVNAHVHSVQSLGRGIADDLPLMDWLFDHVLPMEASMDAEAMRVAATLGYLECVESGVTTVIDHLSVHHAAEAFEAAIDVGIRGVMGKVLMDREAPAGLQQATDIALAESRELLETYHGAADGRIRYAVTPRFAITCTEDCLRGARALADEYEDVRLHTHASETRDEVDQIEAETGMRNVAWLDEVGLTGEDCLLAHCVWTDDHERNLLAETGTHVVHCPSANMKLGSGVAPVRDYLERGVPVALGNDGPPCNNTLDPFTELRQASLLASVEDRDPTALPATTALRMATRHGAQAAGFDRLGALREGWRADVVGLDYHASRAVPVHDPVSHLVYATHGDDVTFTMVDGEVVFADGTVRTVDASAVRKRAQELADSHDW